MTKGTGRHPLFPLENFAHHHVVGKTAGVGDSYQFVVRVDQQPHGVFQTQSVNFVRDAVADQFLKSVMQAAIRQRNGLHQLGRVDGFTKTRLNRGQGGLHMGMLNSHDVRAFPCDHADRRNIDAAVGWPFFPHEQVEQLRRGVAGAGQIIIDAGKPHRGEFAA